MREEDVTILLAKEGNERAFRRLYDDNFERIYSLAFRYTRSQEDAEDVMQETFMKAFNSIRKYRFDRQASFSTWLHSICINCSIDCLRRRRGTAERTTSLETLPMDPPAPDASPHDAAERAEMLAAIAEAASSLTPRARVIFDLRHGQHLRLQEIASLIGSSESAVKTHLARSHETLKRRLESLWRET